MGARAMVVALLGAGGAALLLSRRANASVATVPAASILLPPTPKQPGWLEALKNIRFDDPVITRFGGNTVDAITQSSGAWTGPLPTFGVANWRPHEKSRPYLRAVLDIESKHGLPRGLLARLIQQESMWNPAARNAASGAYGLAQFMAPTAREYGVILDGSPWDDIDGAARYLVWLKKYLGGWAFAVAGYNWGPGNVKRKGIWNAPAETRAYIDRISGDIMGINYAQAANLHREVMA